MLSFSSPSDGFLEEEWSLEDAEEEEEDKDTTEEGLVPLF